MKWKRPLTRIRTRKSWEIKEAVGVWLHRVIALSGTRSLRMNHGPRFALFGLSQPSSHHGWLGWNFMHPAHTLNTQYNTGYVSRSWEDKRHSAQRRTRPAPVATFSCTTLGSQSEFWRILVIIRDPIFYCKNLVFKNIWLFRPITNHSNPTDPTLWTLAILYPAVRQL